MSSNSPFTDVPNLLVYERQGDSLVHVVILYTGEGVKHVEDVVVKPSEATPHALAQRALNTQAELNAQADVSKVALGPIDLTILVPAAPSAEFLAEQAFVRDYRKAERLAAFSLPSFQPLQEAFVADLDKRASQHPEYFDVL